MIRSRLASTILCVLLMSLGSCREASSEDELVMLPPLRPIAVGDTLPELTARLLDGEPVHLSAFKGRVFVLHVWAAGCTSCMSHFPFLRAVYHELGEYGLEIVSLSLDSASADEDVRDAVKRHGIRHVVLRDPERKFWGATGMRGYPPLLVVDSKGVIRHLQRLPVLEGREPDWEPVVRQLVKVPRS